MFTGSTVFAQLMDFLPRRDFHDCVARYHGDYRLREFSCRDQFLTLAFAQLTYRESLRDIETCLQALGPKLSHAGFRSPISRSTLADANSLRDWRIYADFAHILIGRARQLYAHEPLGVRLKKTVYALDSTTADLCLSLFPWAKFRRRKAAIKMHTLLDLRGNIPCFIHVSQGKTHDVNILDTLPIEPNAFYVMDRGYLDFARLHRFATVGAFFVIRSKRNGVQTAKLYPEPIRRIAFHDGERDRRLVFLTNNTTLAAITIAKLYRARWQVELFVKWIKQNLRIKAFYGTSENAVKTQIWVAISVYVLVAILRKELKIDQSQSAILQILSLTLFEKMPLIQAFSGEKPQNTDQPRPNQQSLFDL
jgi:hypothetical protein